jgi:hypothetical protein
MANKNRSPRRKVVDSSKRAQQFRSAQAFCTLRAIQNSLAARNRPMSVYDVMIRLRVSPEKFVAHMNYLGQHHLINVRKLTCEHLKSAFLEAQYLANKRNEPLAVTWDRVAREHAARENFLHATVSADALRVFTARLRVSPTGQTALGRHFVPPEARNKNRHSRRDHLFTFQHS